MSYVRKSEPTNFEAQYAVCTLLSHYGPRDVISTRNALRAIRLMVPTCHEADEELVALIVNEAAGRATRVTIDH